jgi:hypothetical protein
VLPFAEISEAKNDAPVKLIAAELSASPGGQTYLLAAVNCD